MINLILPYVQDTQLAALKEKHKKDQQLMSLKSQLAHRSEYRSEWISGGFRFIPLTIQQSEHLIQSIHK